MHQFRQFYVLGKSCIFHLACSLKVAFFQIVRFVFLDLQISKKIFQKTNLNLNFKIPAYNIILFWAEILNCKLKIFGIFFF